MRPYTDWAELQVARARAEDLRRDWQAANAGGFRRERTGPRPRTASMRGTREAAGRLLIAIGRRLLPVEIEPCS
jgi:hypothetical protein